MKKAFVIVAGFFLPPFAFWAFLVLRGAPDPIRFMIDRLRAGNFDRDFMNAAVFFLFVGLVGAAAFGAIFEFFGPKVLSEEEVAIREGKLLIREEIRRVQAKGAIAPKQADRIWSKLSARFVTAMRRK